MLLIVQETMEAPIKDHQFVKRTKAFQSISPCSARQPYCFQKVLVSIKKLEKFPW